MAFGQPSCSKGLYIGTGNTVERKRSGKERRKVMEGRGKAKVGRKEAMENVVQNVARGYRGCCCLLLLMNTDFLVKRSSFALCYTLAALTASCPLIGQ